MQALCRMKYISNCCSALCLISLHDFFSSFFLLCRQLTFCWPFTPTIIPCPALQQKNFYFKCRRLKSFLTVCLKKNLFHPFPVSKCWSFPFNFFKSCFHSNFQTSISYFFHFIWLGDCLSGCLFSFNGFDRHIFVIVRNKMEVTKENVSKSR